jgi:transposase
MGKPRKRYTTEFKIEAVHLYETSGKSASQIEREIGIGAGNLWRWKRKYGSDIAQDAADRGGRTLEQERIHALERENEILRQERDILKKQSPSSRNQSREVPVHC